MADTLTNFSKLINSPPGQLATGGVLFGIVWGFFKGVESVLADDAKLEIAVWLLDAKARSVSPRWRSALTSYFRSVCGEPHTRHRFTATGATALLAFAVVCRSIAASLKHFGPLHSLVEWLLFSADLEVVTLTLCFGVVSFTFLAMDDLLGISKPVYKWRVLLTALGSFIICSSFLGPIQYRCI